jgi:hypothetical protein
VSNKVEFEKLTIDIPKQVLLCVVCTGAHMFLFLIQMCIHGRTDLLVHQ